MHYVFKNNSGITLGAARVFFFSSSLSWNSREVSSFGSMEFGYKRLWGGGREWGERAVGGYFAFFALVHTCFMIF